MLSHVGETDDRGVQGAWLTGLVAPERQAQHARLVTLVRNGRLVLLAATALTTLTALLALAQGYGGLASWLAPLGSAALAIGFHLVLWRLTERPPGGVEVPLELVDPLADIVFLVTDLEQELAVTLDRGGPRLAAEARRRLVLVGRLAGALLTAQRDGDQAAAGRLRADLDREQAGLRRMYDELVAGPQPAGPSSVDGDGPGGAPLEFIDEAPQPSPGPYRNHYPEAGGEYS